MFGDSSAWPPLIWMHSGAEIFWKECPITFSVKLIQRFRCAKSCQQSNMMVVVRWIQVAYFCGTWPLPENPHGERQAKFVILDSSSIGLCSGTMTWRAPANTHLDGSRTKKQDVRVAYSKREVILWKPHVVFTQFCLIFLNLTSKLACWSKTLSWTKELK